MFNLMYYSRNNQRQKNNIISSSVDCCVATSEPLLPGQTAFVRIRLSQRVWLIVVSAFLPQRPWQLPWFVVFRPFLPSHYRMIVACISLLPNPHTSARIPIDCCVLWCIFVGLSGLYHLVRSRYGGPDHQPSTYGQPRRWLWLLRRLNSRRWHSRR